jgi:hypothetical protein
MITRNKISAFAGMTGSVLINDAVYKLSIDDVKKIQGRLSRYGRSFQKHTDRPIAY